MQAHTDMVVYENTATHSNYDELRHSTQHQNDSEDEKNTEHHHHCVIISFPSTFILSDFNFNAIEITQINIEIFFCQNLYLFTFLDNFFQPPQV